MKVSIILFFTPVVLFAQIQPQLDVSLDQAGLMHEHLGMMPNGNLLLATPTTDNQTPETPRIVRMKWQYRAEHLNVLDPDTGGRIGMFTPPYVDDNAAWIASFAPISENEILLLVKYDHGINHLLVINQQGDLVGRVRDQEKESDPYNISINGLESVSGTGELYANFYRVVSGNISSNIDQRWLYKIELVKYDEAYELRRVGPAINKEVYLSKGPNRKYSMFQGFELAKSQNTQYRKAQPLKIINQIDNYIKWSDEYNAPRLYGLGIARFDLIEPFDPNSLVEEIRTKGISSPAESSVDFPIFIKNYYRHAMSHIVMLEILGNDELVVGVKTKNDNSEWFGGNDPDTLKAFQTYVQRLDAFGDPLGNPVYLDNALIFGMNTSDNSPFVVALKLYSEGLPEIIITEVE